MAGAASGTERTADHQPKQPVVQWRDGGYHIRCPHCYYRLFTSDTPHWVAVFPDDERPNKIAIKCPQRRGGESGGRCGRVTVLVLDQRPGE